MIKISKSIGQTKKIASRFAKTVKRGDIVLLNGEMGAGKTVFAKGFAKGLGILENITSPTYIYVNDYDDFLYHFDCYRIENPDMAIALGLDEYFSKGGICLIEWAEKILPIIPTGYRSVNIKKISPTQREIEIV